MEEISRWLQKSIEREAHFQSLLDLVRARAASTTMTQAKVLQEGLEILDDVNYFRSATDNSGEIYSFIDYLQEHRSDFGRIGAHGCLRAMEKLLPFCEKEQNLPTQAEQYAYYRETESARAPFEAMAEDTGELLELLIGYAGDALKDTESAP